MKTYEFKDNVKVVNSFCVVGINPEIKHNNKVNYINYDNKENFDLNELIKNDALYIERIDIIKSTNIKGDEYNEEMDGRILRYIRLDSKSNYWLRLFYVDEYNIDEPPITDIKFIECEYFNNDYIVRLVYNIIIICNV